MHELDDINIILHIIHFNSVARYVVAVNMIIDFISTII